MRWREIRTPGADELETPLEADEEAIRVLAPLDARGADRVAEAIAERPETALWLEDRSERLGILSAVPGLRRLRLHSLNLESLDGLASAPGLTELVLGDTLRRLSLRPIADLAGLRRLAINGTWKDPETIGTLTGLERLGIGSIDLDLLRPLVNLRRFESGLGTVRSLPLLPEIGRLELVELYRLRGPHDLAPLGRIATLRYLVLASTRSVTSLPSLAACPDLRWIALDEMRGLHDLRPIADAPNLEVLLLIGMSQLDAESLRPLVGHPTLRAGVWGFGSDRRNAAAQDLLPLPPEPWNYPADRSREPAGAPLPWERPDWDGIRHPTRT
jgi:hypothetical protein